MEYNDDRHEYRLNGEKFEGVTSFISRFKVPFEKEKVAEIVAQKQGTSTDKILKLWKLKGDMAREFGDAVHDAIEMWIKFGEKPTLPYLKEIVDKFADKYDRNNLYSEKVAYDTEHKIAGRIDIIEKGFNIIDIKTNADLSKKAYNNFLPPINLPQTKLNEYRLQLSLYKYMCDKKGLKINKLIIEHWNDGFETIELEPFDVKKIWKHTQ